MYPFFMVNKYFFTDFRNYLAFYYLSISIQSSQLQRQFTPKT